MSNDHGKHSGGQLFSVNQRVKILVQPDFCKLATVTEVEEVNTGVVHGQTLVVKLDSGESRVYTNHQVMAI